MRRRDREITDENAIAEFIAKEQILRIAFYDEGDIYLVPVNYGYSYDEQYSFYFHGAKAGRKYELAKKKPTVGFEIDGNYMLIGSEIQARKRQQQCVSKHDMQCQTFLVFPHPCSLIQIGSHEPI